MATTLFGICFEGSIKLDERYVAAMAEILGPHRCARISVPWDTTTNPRLGEFSLGMYVDNCKLLKQYGYVVLLGNNWAPPWASEGKPTYCEFVHGCSLDDGIRFAFDREWCRNPAHIDPQAKYSWSSGLAIQCGPWIDYASDLNELGIWVFWPPMSLGDQQAGLRRAVVESYVPFVQAFRKHAPQVKLIGFEAQGADEIWRLLQLESEHAHEVEPGLTEMFPHGISYHYPLNREAEYEQTAFGSIHLHGRPLYITEAGYHDINLTLQEAEQTLIRNPKPLMFIWYQNIGQGLTMVDMQTFRPNAMGEAVKSLIQRHTPPPSREELDRGLAELRTWSDGRRTQQPADNPETTLNPGSWLAYWLSTYDAVPIDVSNPRIKKIVERIDERFKHPLLGGVVLHEGIEIKDDENAADMP